jgi:hypothetical protein
MRRCVLLVALAACSARLGGPLPDARACEGGDRHMSAPDGSCLVWFSAKKDYVDAQAACATIDAHLAYVKTAELDGVAEPLCGASDTFAGATDRAVEGMWVWDDGTPLVYTNWESGEPSNGGSGGTYTEDCLVIAASRAAKGWDDRPCDPSQIPTSGTFAYLCQY